MTTPNAVASSGTVRIIARLDIKLDHVIKGIHLEGWRKMGIPGSLARRYYEQGADELLYMDVVASLYQRNNLTEIVRSVAREVLIPITVGGGIRSTGDVDDLLAVGADKVAINTAATENPSLLTSISETYGSQATVLSLEAKRHSSGRWEAMTDNGRNHTGRDVVEWVQEAVQRGAGEVLVTSIDQDGTRQGFDVELLTAVAAAVDVPVIASGGAGSAAHAVRAVVVGGASAVALGMTLHTGALTVDDVRRALNDAGVRVREVED